MSYADLLNDFINDGMSTVYYYRMNTLGSVQCLLLDDLGNELAWRWNADGSSRWRDDTVAQSSFSALPSEVDFIDLSQGLKKALFISDLLGLN
ncbi:hypothetical protein [Kluyvera ascorbata]|uniref:hypothetical protein n=1 Tax=Kluyvera ascorbata TaxID=51288 RepID=UPI0039F6EE64